MKQIIKISQTTLRFVVIASGLLVLLSGLYISLIDDPTYQISNRDPFAESQGDPRNQTRTYTTFPEWHIVYSAEEYAAFLASGNLPSDFPFFAATEQYNQIESAMINHIGGPSEIDQTTQTVLDTISTSFALENGAKGIYEKTFGRLSYWLNFKRLTNEDQYIAQEADRYATFLFHTPWFAFTYQDAFFGLWQSYALSSISPRGLERRIAFSVGYVLKGTFGRIINTVSQSSYGGAGQITYVEIEKIDATTASTIPNVELYTASEREHTTVLLPRYRAFKDPFLALLEAGATIVSIQGHDQIMLSVVTNSNSSCTYLNDQKMYDFPILTQPTESRYLLDLPVTELSAAVNTLAECQIAIEHFYDY